MTGAGKIRQRNRQRRRLGPLAGTAMLALAPLVTGGNGEAHLTGGLNFKGIAIGMTKREVCSLESMAFANEVPCRTWQGDTLGPPRPDPMYDWLRGVPAVVTVHFNRRDDPGARVDEISANFAHADYGTVRQALVVQYGPPTRQETGKILLGQGREVASRDLVWERPGGGVRLLERVEEPDRSGFLIIWRGHS